MSGGYNIVVQLLSPSPQTNFTLMLRRQSNGLCRRIRYQKVHLYVHMTHSRRAQELVWPFLLIQGRGTHVFVVVCKRLIRLTTTLGWHKVVKYVVHMLDIASYFDLDMLSRQFFVVAYLRPHYYSEGELTNTEKLFR